MWFDVETEEETMSILCVVLERELWFDVETEEETIDTRQVIRHKSCGLM